LSREFVKDIPPPRAVSDALPEAERLRFVLGAAHLGDWSWDARTDFLTLSERAAAVFEVPPSVPIPWATLRERLHPDDRERERAAAEAALASFRGTGGAQGSEYAVRYRVSSGHRERAVRVIGRPIHDAAGQLLGMYGVVQDITGERILWRIDEALRPLTKSEEITFAAAQILGEHLDVHRCAYAFVEEDEDTFVLTGNYTNGVHSIVGRYRFRQFGAECLRLMRAGQPWAVEDSLAEPRLDEEDRAAYASTAIRAVICVPILKSGRFVAAMAVHRNDVRRWSSSEIELVQQVASRCWESIERARVELERERLLEAARAANQTKDEFLAMLGHELRNPLAPIVTALQVMDLKGDAATRRERTIVERQVEHLRRLVDDLLDVSRIARGKVEFKREPVELAEIVRQAVEVAKPLIDERGHALEVAVPPGGLAVHGDVARLTQVVSNLLTNASKYTSRGGRIAIRGDLEADEVVLRVRDNGMGMTPEVLRGAFDLFVQGRQALDRAQGGLGLGLSIVKSLVERHGGSVAAHSAGSNQGSEFVVRLPRLSPDQGLEAAASERSGAAEPTGRPARLLVVDDNRDAAGMLQAALEMRGHQVWVAHDGPEALRLVAANVVDIALLDIGLPAMDGFEVAHKMREVPGAERTKLVALTGYGQEADRVRTRAAGFVDHLVKPVKLGALEAVIAELLGPTSG
jgi:signal transduction histidine kinase